MGYFLKCAQPGTVFSAEALLTSNGELPKGKEDIVWLFEVIALIQRNGERYAVTNKRNVLDEFSTVLFDADGRSLNTFPSDALNEGEWRWHWVCVHDDEKPAIKILERAA